MLLDKLSRFQIQIDFLLEGCKSDGNKQSETRASYQVPLKASLDLFFVVYLSQNMSQTGPLAESSSEGMKGGWQEGG